MLLRLIKAQTIMQCGFRPQVITLTTVGAIGQQLQRSGVTVESLGMRSILGAPLALWRLVRRLRALGPDVVQTWMYHADLLGGLAARLSGVKHVIWGIRTTDISKGGSRATALVRWLCARVSHRIPSRIICAAQAALRVHAGLGYAADRMVVIPNGFDMARLQASSEQVAALRAYCGFGADTIVVGMLGRFNSVKDQQNFVQAAGLLARQYGSVRFLMVGRDCDAANPVLATWIASTGVAERFVLLGERSDAPVCLAAMDVFALPSRTEGFPNVLAEAMAMGRPCVTTDVGDAAFVLDECGVVVPSEDAAALANGMRQLIELPPRERAALGRLARERVEREFSMERCAQRFADVYADVMNSSKR